MDVLETFGTNHYIDRDKTDQDIFRLPGTNFVPAISKNIGIYNVGVFSIAIIKN